jgi:hypothetical protein
MLFSVFRSRAVLQVEILALRHQIGVPRPKKRLTLTVVDRLFWAWLSGIWPDWRSPLVFVRPETVIAWHRQRFRVFWTWKIRHGQTGKPRLAASPGSDPYMNRANPLGGAPRLHGELFKLGIDIGETSVGKYMVRHRKPPTKLGAPSWTTTSNIWSRLTFSRCPPSVSRVCTCSWVLAHERPAHTPLQRHSSSHCGMDRPTTSKCFPLGSAPGYLLRDRDRIFGHHFTQQVQHMGMEQVLFLRRDPRGKELTSNASSAPSGGNASII